MQGKTEKKQVQLGDRTYPLLIRHRSSREAFLYGGRKSLTITGLALLALLPFGLLEPFLFLIWGSVAIAILVLLVGPFLHLKYWKDRITFDYADAECPHCKKNVRLGPFVSNRLQKRIILLCRECGQTCVGVPL